jgi:kynureninase
VPARSIVEPTVHLPRTIVPAAPDTEPGSISARELATLRAEFPILDRKTYLNSCSLGALSRRSEAYLHDFTRLWHEMGASAWYHHWLGRVEELRTRVARFWGSSPAEVALLPSTSAALSAIAESVPHEGRTRVVCTELDFPTLVYQWVVKPEIELVVLESRDGVSVAMEQFAEAVDERTLFLATSHVFFATGAVQDVSALAELAHDVGAYCLIDGYQGLGQVPLDLSATAVDFYTGGPLKWLCGGPGLAYLYVRRDLIDGLEPRITSWFATEGSSTSTPGASGSVPMPAGSSSARRHCPPCTRRWEARRSWTRWAWTPWWRAIAISCATW